MIALGLALAGCTRSGAVTTATVASPSPTGASPGSSAAPTPKPSKAHAKPVAAPAAALRQVPVPQQVFVAARQPAHPLPTPATCHGVPSGLSASQLILVRSSGTYAQVSACRRSGSTWLLDLGPYSGHVGYTGVTPAGSKREGDGHTPAGVYSMGYGFGLSSNPGLAMGWRGVRSGDVWVDDPRSSLYNSWQTNPSNGRWSSAESLNQPGPYSLAQVINYNTARTPYQGSAIFLHVDTGGATAGCVAIGRDQLTAVFRWERSGTLISIA